MHRLVQLSTRAWLKGSGNHDVFLQLFITRLSESFPTGDCENQEACRELFAHVQVALGNKPKGRSLSEWATLCHNGGAYARFQGRYDIAERMASEAMETRKKIIGEDDNKTLQSTSLFAMVISDEGQWEKAEKLQVQLIETHKKKLGAGHPDTLNVMSSLASTYYKQGRWEEAEKLEEQVIKAYKSELGADDGEMLIGMSNLASIYSNQGRWEEAKKLQEQIVEACKIKLGTDHSYTIRSIWLVTPYMRSLA